MKRNTSVRLSHSTRHLVIEKSLVVILAFFVFKEVIKNSHSFLCILKYINEPNTFPEEEVKERYTASDVLPLTDDVVLCKRKG